MDNDQKWEIVHQHRRMVSRGLTDPIFCDFGHIPEEMVPAVGNDDEPVLRCLKCRTVLNLGLLDYERMKNTWNS